MSSWVRSWLLSPSQGSLVQDEPGSVSAWGVRDADRRRATQFPSRGVSLGGPVGRTGGRSTTHFAMDTVGCQASDRCPSFCSSGATFASTRPAETHARVDLGPGRRLPATAGSWPLIAPDAFPNPPRGTPGRIGLSRKRNRLCNRARRERANSPSCSALAALLAADNPAARQGSSAYHTKKLMAALVTAIRRRRVSTAGWRQSSSSAIRLQTRSAPHTATCPPYS
jgi:hypothetical protein